MHIGNFATLLGSDLADIQGPSLPRGAITLSTSIGNFDSDNLRQIDSTIERDKAHIVWATPGGELTVSSDWRCDNTTGVWQRTDVLSNTGAQAVTVYRALARFVLLPGQYEVNSQGSNWCRENQGTWQPLVQGGLVLHCEGGQTCRGATPYLCIREIRQKTGMAFHVLPWGNWTITATTHTARQGSLPFVVVELGLNDDHLHLLLQPQQSIALPDIVFQTLPDGDPTLGAPQLHRYVSSRLLPPPPPDPPVVYNTWYDVNEWFTVERLRAQLAAARQIGCDVFVVDAGWFGAGSGGWSDQVGDWREKLDGGLHGRMADFANEVRAAGLGFGLWMEPERLAAGVPIVREHPQWFITTDGVFYYPDLENPEAYNYIRGEMARLIETYRLVWMKIDFNFERGADRSGSEYATYYRLWYRLLDELRHRYAGVFFEGCASGGLRLDINTLRHFDAHWLSDDVSPRDVLRIYQGALLRLPPGRLTKWAVLSTQKQAPSPLARLGWRRPITIAPASTSWDQAVPTDVDFAARVALPGLFGLSGDIAGLPRRVQERLAYHVAFFKKWRNFIVSSVAHLLTSPAPIDDGSGWAAIQLQDPQDLASLLFVYRLDDPAGKMRFRLRDLDPSRIYTATMDNLTLTTASGKELMDNGITVDLPRRNNAQVVVVTPS